MKNSGTANYIGVYRISGVNCHPFLGFIGVQALKHSYFRWTSPFVRVNARQMPQANADRRPNFLARLLPKKAAFQPPALLGKPGMSISPHAYRSSTAAVRLSDERSQLQLLRYNCAPSLIFSTSLTRKMRRLGRKSLRFYMRIAHESFE